MLAEVINRNLYLKFIHDIFYIIGNTFLSFCKLLGRFAIFFYNLFHALFSRKFFFDNFKSSLFVNGFCSIPVVGLTGIFTGAVLSMQLYYSLEKFGITETIPAIVLIALIKELGPVLSGLMIVARVGSSISAQIGGMVVGNQIDSLITLSADPFKFLYVPRILAVTLATPLLTIVASIIGVFGSFLVMTNLFDLSPTIYINLTVNAFEWYDLKIGLIKAIVFGFIISSIACYNGSRTINGSVGIGKSTISTVVSGCIYVLFFNFIITSMMAK